MKPLSRRTLLRGAGGVAVGLPFLEAMLPSRRAEAAALIPKRFLPFFTANGTLLELGQWNATGSENNFSFASSSVLSPLEPHKQDLVYLTGIDQKHGGYGDAHQQGMGATLTGQMVNSGTTPAAGGALPCGLPAGPSLDQVLAPSLRGNAKFASREFAIQPYSFNAGTVTSYLSYRAANDPAKPETDPYAAFDTLFTDLGTNTGQLDLLRARRKSVLDLVKSEFASVKSVVGTTDRQRLDKHLTAIRELELRLTSTEVITQCNAPNLGPRIDPDANDNFPALGKAFMDIIALAFACDLTRVASLQWSCSVSQTVYNWVNAGPYNHHALSHNASGVDLGIANTETDSAVAFAKLVKIENWLAQQFAYLTQQLKAIPEGNGTVLDNTLVLWCNELGSSGGGHQPADAPYLIAGRAGGTIQTGRWLNYDGEYPYPNLLVTIANKLGVPMTTFGEPSFCTGALGRL